MKSFEYIQPKSLSEASQSLGTDWNVALPYAGGSDLYGMIKHRLVSPERVVNLKTLPDLNTISHDKKQGLKVGALVNIADIAENQMILEKFTILAQAASEVASPQLRNMGTIGGNICQRPRCWYFRGPFNCLRKGGDICYAADGENKYHCITGGGPCFIVHPSDTAVALLALNASLVIYDGKDSREVLLKEFFILPEQNVHRENILKPGEILTHILIPEPAAGTLSGYIKVKERGAWDFAIVSVGAVLQLAGKTIKSGSVAFGGVAPVPWLEQNLGSGLKNMAVTKRNFFNLSQEAFKEAYPLSENEYKLIMARNLTGRILQQLTAV